jgi:hypothetical protein
MCGVMGRGWRIQGCELDVLLTRMEQHLLTYAQSLAHLKATISS